MGANSNAPVVREDVLRGIRWGMIVLIAALLAIAAYRVFGTSPASAAPKIETEPAAVPPVVQVAPAIEAGEGTATEAPSITGPDVPPAPPSRRQQKAPVEPEDRGKAFIPPSITTTSRAAMTQDIDSALPDAPALDVKAAPVAVAPSKMTAAKQEDKGSRVGKVAKSVGKIFGIGRKDSPEPGK